MKPKRSKRPAMKLTLTLDHGLASHLLAAAKGGFVGTVKEQAVYWIRSGIIEWMGNENLRKMIVPHLPDCYRRHYPVQQGGGKPRPKAAPG